jgi:CBS domain-containing protein
MSDAQGTGLTAFAPKTQRSDTPREAPGTNVAPISERARAPAVTVGGLMKAGVPSVSRADRLALAAARMRARRVDALAVMDTGRLAGIVSAGDVLRAVADGVSTDAIQVADYMTPARGPVAVADHLSVAARRMIKCGVRHLPVVNEGRVVGVISARDLLVGWEVPLELTGPGQW